MAGLSLSSCLANLKFRFVKDSNWNYEYFHKDHLGNTRVVYGHQKQVDVYKATMETPTPIANKEQSEFYNINTRRVTAFNRTPASIEVTAPNQSAETNGNLNKTIGPAKMIQVSTGDRVQLEVFARYATGTGSNNTLISNLASVVTGSFALTAGESAHTALTNNVPPQAATIGQTTGVPKAYLFYILFNSSYAYQQFGYVAVNSTALAGHQQMYLDITVPTGGYLYTYVANEANVSSATSVYFDDFTIVHTRNTPTLQVLQTNDYYPFGLQIAAPSYQKQTALDNDYLYNGKELQDEHNLGWMDYGQRMYASELGRFFTQDRFAEKYLDFTAYQYGGNNPTLFIDVNGDSLAVKEIDAGSIDKFKQNVQNGSGGHWLAEVDDDTGLVTLVENKDIDGQMNKDQASFVKELSKVTTGNGVATINLVDNSEKVVIGDIATNTVDVGDMQRLGTDGKITAQKTLIHEVSENYDVQVNKTSTMGAHLKAANAENRIGKAILDPINRSITPSNNPSFSTLTVPVIGPPEQRGVISIHLYKNNVINTSGNKIKSSTPLMK